MNTPTHLLVAAVAFAKPDQPRLSIAALFGALVPDASLYFMVAWHGLIVGTPAEVIFGQLYYDDYWQLIFAVDNSFFLWGIALIVGLALRAPILIAFAGAGILHLLCDFPLHHDDARAHFWPLTLWKFESPVSYWDSRHYGDIVALFEAALVVGLCVILWRRFERRWTRAAIATTGVLTLAPFVVFGLILQGGPG